MGWNNKRGINKDSYQFIVYLGRDLEGKKREKRKTVNLSHIVTEKKRDAEAQRLFTIWESKVKGGNYVKNEKINLRDFYNKWLEEYAQSQLQPKTLFEYKKLLKRIDYALGDIKLVNINPEILLEFYQNLRETGIRRDKKFIPKNNFIKIINSYGFSYSDIKAKSNVADSVITSLRQSRSIQQSTAIRISNALKLANSTLFVEVYQDKGLSEKTILHYHRLIGTILNFAVQLGYLTKNPVDKTPAPKLPDEKAKLFDLKETVYILYLLKEKNTPLKYHVMIVLAIFTGMREGEIAALNWKDVDLKTGYIKVNKSLQHIAGEKTSVKSTKTKNYRTVGVPPSVIPLLKEYKAWQDNEKKALGDLWKGSDALFTAVNGTPIFPSTISKWFLKFMRTHNKAIEEDIDIPKQEKKNYKLTEINFHGLRHTNATLLNTLGIALSKISKELGHTKLSTTTDIYINYLGGIDNEIVDAMEKTLGSSV